MERDGGSSKLEQMLNLNSRVQQWANWYQGQWFYLSSTAEDALSLADKLSFYSQLKGIDLSDIIHK